MQRKQKALWVAALLAPLALLTLFLFSRPPASPGTDVAMGPERPNAEPPRSTEPVSLAEASAGPSNEQVNLGSTVDPTPLSGAATDSAPYDVHFQVVWKFAQQREPGALPRPSKVVLCTASGPRILECDQRGSASTTLSSYELRWASAGRLHCVAVNDDGHSLQATPIAVLPAGETRVAVPIDKEWPSCVIDLRFPTPDGITDMLQVEWRPNWVFGSEPDRVDPEPCDHRIDLRELAELDGADGSLSRMGRDLPRRIRLVGVVEGLTHVNVALVRRNPFRETTRTALVQSGGSVLIDFDRSLTEQVVTLAVAADGPAAEQGALEFSVAGVGWERSPPVEVGHGPRAEMKLWAPATYELWVKEAGSDFTCRSSQFSLDASGSVVHAGPHLSVSRGVEHEVITVGIGRRLEISPQRMRELRAFCDSMEIVFEGHWLPTRVFDSAGSDHAYARDLESLASRGSKVRVYAPEGAKILGRSNEDHTRNVMLDVGSWFQE